MIEKYDDVEFVYEKVVDIDDVLYVVRNGALYKLVGVIGRRTYWVGRKLNSIIKQVSNEVDVSAFFKNLRKFPDILDITFGDWRRMIRAMQDKKYREHLRETYEARCLLSSAVKMGKERINLLIREVQSIYNNAEVIEFNRGAEVLALPKEKIVFARVGDRIGVFWSANFWRIIAKYYGGYSGLNPVREKSPVPLRFANRVRLLDADSFFEGFEDCLKKYIKLLSKYGKKDSRIFEIISSILLESQLND